MQTQRIKLNYYLTLHHNYYHISQHNNFVPNNETLYFVLININDYSVSIFTCPLFTTDSIVKFLY
jgi:hypothetical protein